MRVCLINPPRMQPKLWGKPSIVQPLDIAYVAALLEKEHDVHIIDAPNEEWKTLEVIDGNKYRQGLKNEEILSRVKQWSPDVIGITIPFSGWCRPVFEIASLIKEYNEQITIVLSGLHASARPFDSLSKGNVDFVVIGEPEHSYVDLIQTLEKRNEDEPKKVLGIGYLRNGKPILTPPRPFIHDLDSLPFPARHLLPMEKYFSAVKENPLRGEIDKPWATMISSRGCPHDCIFCSVHTHMGKNWRGRSAENVVDEIEELIQKYNIKQLDFNDENLSFDKNRLEKICDLIVEQKIDIDWYTPNGVRADTLDCKILSKMMMAGCRKIRLAPESGVQRVVDQVIKKNQSLEDVEKAIIFSKKIGIKVGCFFVIGLIGETKEDIKKSIDYAYKLKSLGAESFHFSLATPIYGTDLYDQALKGGYLRECFSDDNLATAEPLIETDDFSSEELIELCKRANMINSTLTLDKMISAAKNPRKIIMFIAQKIESKQL